MPNRPKGKNKTWIAPVEKKTNSADKWGNDTNWYNKKEWKRLRNYYINKQPLCEICKRFGKIVEAKVVDHIVRVKVNPDIALKEYNLQSLCHRCHNIKSGYEGHYKK